MNRQRQPTPPPSPPPPQGDLGSPSSPGTPTFWVGSSTSSSMADGSRTSSDSREEVANNGSRQQGARSIGDNAEYVLVSVKNSFSGSESSSRRSSSSLTGAVGPPSQATHASSIGHSRSSSNSSSITDPFSPTSPRGNVDPNSYGQSVGMPVAGNNWNFAGATAGTSLGNFQAVSNGNGAQNLPLAGNIGNTGSFVLPGNFANLSNPGFMGDAGNHQSAMSAGNAGQNVVFFPSAGNLSGMTLADNTGNFLAANPGQMLMYSGGTFIPVNTSSMATLPQGGYDAGAVLLQQQYGLSPDLLAASLGETLLISQGQPLAQNVGPLQSPASLPQGQPASLGLSQAQLTPQTLSWLQAQASLSQPQPMQENPNVSQAQTMLQNLALSQAQGAPPQTFHHFSQAQMPGTSQAQPIPPQNPNQRLPQTSTPQTALHQQPLVFAPQAHVASGHANSSEPETTNPSMGRSFEVLWAIMARQGVYPMATNPQLLPADDTFGLPSSLTGLRSEDPQVSHDQEAPQIRSPAEGPSKTADDPDTHPLHTSLDNGDDHATSGVGSSITSSPSISTPTSLNGDLQPLTSEDEGNVAAQMMKGEPRYERPADKEACLRCGRKVYSMEKLGPVKDVLYHKTCFTCVACQTQLNLKNFHHNESDLADLNVYCASHKLAARAKPMDSSAMGIKRALTVPKPGRVNEQIRGGPDAMSVHLDAQSVSIRSAMQAPAPDLHASNKQREGAWFREHRRHEGMPPEDVVRHDEKQYEGSRSLYYYTGSDPQ